MPLRDMDSIFEEVFTSINEGPTWDNCSSQVTHQISKQMLDLEIASRGPHNLEATDGGTGSPGFTITSIFLLQPFTFPSTPFEAKFSTVWQPQSVLTRHHLESSSVQVLLSTAPSIDALAFDSTAIRSRPIWQTIQQYRSTKSVFVSTLIHVLVNLLVYLFQRFLT